MRIGIILTGDYSWAGGLYYSLNLIKLLAGLAQNRDLTVVAIVNSSTPPELISELPALNVEISDLDKKPLAYKILHKLSGNRFTADINSLHLDVLYPLISYEAQHEKLNCEVMYWLYDFQHKFLPELFSEEEIKKRDQTFASIAAHAKQVVFSSQDSKKHFDQFYPQSKVKRLVYNFVSLLEKRDDHTKNPVLPEDYFIVCNQFWPHKNHKVVLKAIEALRSDNKIIHVVFTGRHDDPSYKNYVDDLRAYIKTHGLNAQVTLTGFISREEQVNLIINARAVIQPSFFEGWSTVVEDAKALNKFLMVSDIAVNREQILRNGVFFQPEDFKQLAQLISDFTEQKTKVTVSDYAENIAASRNELIRLFKI